MLVAATTGSDISKAMHGVSSRAHGVGQRWGAMRKIFAYPKRMETIGSVEGHGNGGGGGNLSPALTPVVRSTTTTVRTRFPRGCHDG